MVIPDAVPFLLVLARLSGLAIAAPLFGHLLVPPRVRAGFVGALALALAPAVAGPHPAAEPALATLVGLLAVEGAIGVFLGFVAQLVFAGVQLGAQAVGIQMGFGIGDIVDPGAEVSSPVLVQWQQLGALLAFLALDVHHVVLGALLESFRVAPIGTVALSGEVLHGLVAQGGSLFAIGVRIAAPVLLVLLLVNGALAALARTMPQLNVFVVGVPVNVGVGLLVLGASIPFTAAFLGGRFDELGRWLAALVDGLAVASHG